MERATFARLPARPGAAVEPASAVTPSAQPGRGLHEHAGAQHRLIVLRDATRFGVSPSTFRRLVSRRGNRLLFGGVVALGGGPSSTKQRAKAATLAVPGALVTGEMGLHLYGLVPTAPDVVAVVVRVDRSRPRRDGLRVHRTTIPLTEADRRVRDGIDLASVERCLLQVAATRAVPELRGLVATAVQRRLTTLVRIASLLDRAGTTCGVAALRQVVRQLDPERCDSELEYVMGASLRGRGLFQDPGHARVTVRGGRVLTLDVPWSPRWVAVECDGAGYHSEPKAVTLDALRHNAFAGTGWTVLRVTWAVLERHLDELVELLVAALGTSPGDRSAGRTTDSPGRTASLISAAT